MVYESARIYTDCDRFARIDRLQVCLPSLNKACHSNSAAPAEEGVKGAQARRYDPSGNVRNRSHSRRFPALYPIFDLVDSARQIPDTFDDQMCANGIELFANARMRISPLRRRERTDF